MSKKKTPLEAIRAKCKECSCGDKEEIINCPIKTCPLWPYRVELSRMENIDIDVEETSNTGDKKPESKSNIGKSLEDFDIPFDED